MLLNTQKYKKLKGIPALAIALFYGLYSNAQTAIPRNPESYVLFCDSLSFVNQTSFHLTKIIDGDPVKESWYYTLLNDEVVFFQISYSSGDNEKHEVYYLKGRKLICMELFEAVYHPIHEDDVKRGEVYYFDGASIIRTVKLGEALYGSDKDFLLHQKFAGRYYELKKNLRW